MALFPFPKFSFRSNIEGFSEVKASRANENNQSSLAKDQSRLTPQEAKALAALIRFVADEQRVSTTTVNELLKVKFNVGAAQDITHVRYDEAVHFLVKLQLNILLS